MQGAIIFGNEEVQIDLNNITISNSRANYGTLAYLTETTQPTGVYFNLINSPSIVGTTAIYDGALIWAHHTNMDVLIDNVIVKSLTAGNEGGLVYTSNLKTLTITDSEFDTFKAGVAGSLLKSTS